MKKESEFQAGLVKEIPKRIPGSIVIKNDPESLNGVPDLTIFYEDTWAWLEVKRDGKASKRALQPYYVDWAKQRSFGSFISPENKEEVLDELERSFRSHRKTRISKPK